MIAHGYRLSIWGNENVMKLIGVMVVQPREYRTNY